MSENAKRKRFVEAGKLNQFDTKTQKLLEEIDKAQNALEEIQQKTFDHVIALEQRNRELRKPWHEQRSAYIDQIPNFWATTMLNHPDINILLDEEEENCIHHLKKFEVEEFEDVTCGYYLKFSFDDNPYFENNLLMKEYNFMGEPKCVSTNIIWKDGIQPLGQIPDASPPRKRRIEYKSFFNWFRDTTDPLTDDIAEILKDDIWTNPLQYYLVPDIESNDAGSSPSDNSDIDEPRRKEKTERIISKSSAIRVKSSTTTNTSSVSEVSSGSSGVQVISNETRSGELSGTCGAVTSETGTADSESDSGNAPLPGAPPGPANIVGPRRRLYMSGDYGF